jgi:type IV pilus biogenesis protein CpaD/CtpE
MFHRTRCSTALLAILLSAAYACSSSGPTEVPQHNARVATPAWTARTTSNRSLDVVALDSTGGTSAPIGSATAQADTVCYQPTQPWWTTC